MAVPVDQFPDIEPFLTDIERKERQKRLRDLALQRIKQPPGGVVGAGLEALDFAGSAASKLDAGSNVRRGAEAWLRMFSPGAAAALEKTDISDVAQRAVGAAATGVDKAQTFFAPIAETAGSRVVEGLGTAVMSPLDLIGEGLITKPEQFPEGLRPDPESERLVAAFFKGDISGPDLAGALRTRFEENRTGVEQVFLSMFGDPTAALPMGKLLSIPVKMLPKALQSIFRVGFQGAELAGDAPGVPRTFLGEGVEDSLGRLRQPPVAAPVTAANAVNVEAIRQATANTLRTGEPSSEFVYHVGQGTQEDIQSIINNGLSAGGYDQTPMTDKGLGQVIHVFRKSDLPAGLNPNFESDVASKYASGAVSSSQAPKPVATFTWNQVGRKYDELPEGFRAQELGFEGEPPLDKLLSPAELQKAAIADDAAEAKIQSVISASYKNRPGEESLTLGQNAPPIDPNSPLGMANAMWQRGGAHVQTDEPVKFLKFQENFNDIYFGLRKMQGRADPGGWTILPGGDDDLITLITRGPGAASAGATRYALAINEMKALAPNAIADDIGSYVFALHGKEVFAAKGPERVLGQFTSAAQMDEILEQLAAKYGPEGFAQLEQAAEVMKRTYAFDRQRFVDAGIFTQEFADDMAERYPWYNPIHYVEHVEQQAAGPGGKSRGFSVIDDGVMALSEKGSTGDLVRPLEVLADTLIRNEVRLQQNATAKAIVKLALADDATEITKIKNVELVATIPAEDTDDIIKVFRPSGRDKPGTISFMEDGKRQIYKVPDWLYRETNLLGDTMNHAAARIAGAINGISRAAFTTYNPAFVVSNMLNDTLTALVRGGIMPHETVATLIRSTQGLKNDKIMQSFRLTGAYQTRFYGRDVSRLVQEVGATGGQVIGSSAEWTSWLRKAKNLVPNAGEAGEQAPRMALFRRELNKHLPGWESMTAEEIAATPAARKAAADAVELTINFARGGHIIKSLNPFVLFLNAAMEGTKLPIRAMATGEGKMRLAGVATGMTGLTSYNMSYPEYMDIPNDIRWGSVVIMLPPKEYNLDGSPKPNYLTIIPRTREWGAFLGPIIYGMEKMFTDNPTEATTFARTIIPQVSPVNDIPAPNIIEVLFGRLANYDIFRGQPVVPRELEDSPKEEQVSPWVSRTIAEVANMANLSPLRLEHDYEGIFGGAGKAAVSVTDWILNELMPPEKNPRVQEMLSDFEALETKVERDQFWARLSDEDRDSLETARRQPKSQFPVLGPIASRVMPGRGGQLGITARELAAEQTGVSTAQTRAVSGRLRATSDRQLTDQINDDRQLTLEGQMGGISHAKWRERRSDRAVEYRGLLADLGIEFPKAAQVIADPEAGDRYYELVATVAGTQPDRRTKGQILAAGWYSIVLEEQGDGEKDFAKFFEMRDAYEMSLTSEELKLMRETLDAKQTPTEIEFIEDTRKMRPYFNLTPNEMRRTGQLELYGRYLATAPKFQSGFLEKNPTLEITLDILRDLKLAWREAHPDVDALLLKWDHVSTRQDFKGQIDLDIENALRGRAGEFSVPPATTTVPIRGVR